MKPVIKRGWAVSLQFDHGKNGRIVRRLVGPGWFKELESLGGMFLTREAARAAVAAQFRPDSWQPRYGWKPRVERVTLTMRRDRKGD
jgi:hypothetical protein